MTKDDFVADKEVTEQLRPLTPPKDAVLSVRLPIEAFMRLAVEAEMRGITVSALARELLGAYRFQDTGTSAVTQVAWYRYAE